MNKFYLLAALILISAISIFLIVRGANTPKPEEITTKSSQYKLLGAQEFKAQYENDSEGILIDVRTQEEFNTGHVSAAKNIDVQSANFKGELEKLDRSLPYYVYCRSGSRSQAAVAAMKNLGFKTIYELKGGITSWQSLNYPIVKNLD